MSLVRTMYVFGDELGRKVGGGWEVQILEVGSIHVRTCAAAPRVRHSKETRNTCKLTTLHSVSSGQPLGAIQDMQERHTLLLEMQFHNSLKHFTSDRAL